MPPLSSCARFMVTVSEVVTRLNEAQQKGVRWIAEHEAAVARFWDYLKKEPRESSPGSAAN